MTLAVMPCRIYECDMTTPFLSASFIFIMYSINNFFRPYELQLSKPFKYNLYSRHKYLLIILTVVALLYYLFFRPPKQLSGLRFVFSGFYLRIYLRDTFSGKDIL